MPFFDGIEQLVTLRRATKIKANIMPEQIYA